MLLLTTLTVLALVTVSVFIFQGPLRVPPALLLLDLGAALAALIPWNKLPADSFALVGITGMIATAALLTPSDPLRDGLVMLFVLLGAGAVSQGAALGVGLIGSVVAVLPLGYFGPLESIGGIARVLVVAVVVPALVAVARPRPGTREPVAPSALNDYIAVLAHELSTPIVSVGAAAQVLAKELVGRAAERNALAIAEEARQIHRLLESLSDLSALETGRLRLSLRSVDIVGIARGSATSAEVLGHNMVLDLPDEPMYVNADDRRINQVLRNLIGNAAKYSESGTQIELRVGMNSDRRSAIIQVRDHGPGIPPNERTRIFEKFVRLSNAGGIRGSGLGLFISRAIVIDHGGEIWGEWPAGGGSVFSFTLPLAPAPRSRRPAGRQEAGVGQG